MNQNDSPDRGLRQANIEQGAIRIELIETKVSISSKEVFNQNEGIRQIQGFFKIGFLVDDFDLWYSMLENRAVTIHGNVVTDDKGKRMVIVLDPDGNRIQLFEK